MRLPSLCAVFVLLWPSLAQPLQARPMARTIETLVQQILDDTTPGLGVLVTRAGAVLHSAGYGFANLDDETAITPQSLFDLASVSKQMTALAAGLQIEDGLYDEDTPIAEILPALADLDSPRPITVGDLIHHLSGLPDYLEWEEYGSDTPTADVLDWLAGQDLDHAPGDAFDYSNTGYLVLGAVVAAADGVDDLSDVLQARIWGPLGMDDTTLPDPADDNRRVTGYDGTGGNFDLAMDPTIVQGDGNVFTSLDDLALYEAALNAGSLLQDPAALFTNGQYDNGRAIVDGDDIGYGYGWQVYQAGGQSYAAHSGSWTGTSTYYLRNLTTGVSVVLLANGEDADLWELADQIEAAVE